MLQSDPSLLPQAHTLTLTLHSPNPISSTHSLTLTVLHSYRLHCHQSLHHQHCPNPCPPSQHRPPPSTIAPCYHHSVQSSPLLSTVTTPSPDCFTSTVPPRLDSHPSTTALNTIEKFSLTTTVINTHTYARTEWRSGIFKL